MSENEARRLLAQNLRILRMMRGWSQEILGNAAGLNRSYVGALERTSRSASVDAMGRIADAFGVSVSELLRDPDPTELGLELLRAIAREIEEGRE